MVNNVPDKKSNRHVCPECPVSDGGACKEVFHHDSTEGGEDATDDIVGPVSAVGTDRVNQVKSEHSGERPVRCVDGITAKDAEDLRELVLTLGDVIKAKWLGLLGVEWANAAKNNKGDNSHTKVDHGVAQVNWSGRGRLGAFGWCLGAWHVLM